MSTITIKTLPNGQVVLGSHDALTVTGAGGITTTTQTAVSDSDVISALTNSGIIQAVSDDAIDAAEETLTLTNSGSVLSTDGSAVASCGSIDQLTNSDKIKGGAYGVDAAYGIGTLQNNGGAPRWG